MHGLGKAFISFFIQDYRDSIILELCELNQIDIFLSHSDV